MIQRFWRFIKLQFVKFYESFVAYFALFNAVLSPDHPPQDNDSMCSNCRVIKKASAKNAHGCAETM